MTIDDLNSGGSYFVNNKLKMIRIGLSFIWPVTLLILIFSNKK